MVRTKPKSDKVLTIRLPERDLMHLERYCSAEGRTKTEVLRQLIQGLPLVLGEIGAEATGLGQGSVGSLQTQGIEAQSNEVCL